MFLVAQVKSFYGGIMKKILLLLSLGALVLVSCENGKLTSITATPIKKGYWVGESVTAKDIAVTATYKKGATLSVSEFTISHEPFTAAGNATVTVSYNEGSVTQVATCDVTVIALNVLAEGTNGSVGTEGRYVEFGMWPKTIMDDGVTINEEETKTVGMYTYAKGSDGAWYCKAKENGYNPAFTYSDASAVKQEADDSYRWFKVEPIKWRVLSTDFNGKALLWAEYSLTSGVCFFDGEGRTIEETTIYQNNYKHSKIRAFLNGLSYQLNESPNEIYNGNGFLQTAFSAAEQDLVMTTEVDNSPAASNPYENPTRWNNGNNSRCCENTFDKIFLLSQKEATNPDFLFPGAGVKEGEARKRQRKQTDFALANGGNYVDALRCHVLLRTPVWNEYIRPHYIRHAGETEHGNYTTSDGAFGIVPALCIDYKF